MGNSNKTGKKKGNPKKGVNEPGKKRLNDVKTPQVTEEPVHETEESIIEFNREQFDKAKTAIMDGNVSKVLEAIENMKVNMTDPEDSNNTLLHYAASYNVVSVAKYIIEKGGFNMINDQGKTPFDLAKAVCETDSSFTEMKNLLNGVKTRVKC